MPIEHSGILAFNAGTISRSAVARIDVARNKFAAEVQENLMPSVLGPADFRPGTAYQFPTRDNLDARSLRFVFDVDTTARLELTDNVLRAIVNDVVVSRVAVSTAVTNGNFTTDVSGWTDADEAGAVSDWSSVSGGVLRLFGTGVNRAIRRQQVTVAGANIGKEHALRIVIVRGPVGFKVGSASDGDDYVQDTVLREGEHSLAFTPAGDFHITVYSAEKMYKYVDSILVEGVGDMEVPTRWSDDQIRKVRYQQVRDVLFCACDGVIQQRIERRSPSSWSVVDYQPEDGPFRTPNFTATTIAVSGTTGNVTLTASGTLFYSEHVGSLWKLTHTGQNIVAVVAGSDQWSDPIRISGVHEDGPDPREVVTSVSGVFVGTIRLQIAFGDPSGWTDTEQSWTAPASFTIHDKFDNQIVYYRMGFKAGEYTSGSATVTLANSGGVQNGIVRITSVTDSTHANAEVIEQIGSTDATSDWAEGEWSEYRGFPSAVALHDGRLVWGWQDREFLSVSDAYESFDEEMEGDAGPIVRTVTSGTMDGIRWLLSLQRLLAGTAMEEPSVRSSSLDEPLSPTKFTARASSSRGSADIQAMRVDSRGVFIQRGSERAFLTSESSDGSDYSTTNLSRLNEDILKAGVVGIDVQRNPETRIWMWLENGTVAVLTFEPDDEVICWSTVVTQGDVTDMVILPGDPEDIVYWTVERTIGGVLHRWHERMAMQRECVGGPRSKNIDSFVEYVGPLTTTVSVPHLPNTNIVVWAGGKPRPEAYTTNGSGNATLPSPVVQWVAGLGYQGRFKSAKLAYGAQFGMPLSYPQKIDHVALLLQDVAHHGVKIGRDFDHLEHLPRLVEGVDMGAVDVMEDYDHRGFPFNGSWSTDSRLCFTIDSPYCGKFLGLAFSVQTGEGVVPPPRQQRS